MKELSIEEKARRYDEAIEIAKKINNEHKAQPFDVMLKVFPELAESEDEKVRKEIVTYLKSVIANKGYRDKIIESWIAWLEKQGGEQKPVDKVESKFKVGDHIKPVDSCLGSPRTIVDICNSWYVTDQGTLDFEFEDNWEAVEEPVSKDLEKTAKDYSNNLDNIYGSIGEQTRNAFKAGANWQKAKDESTTEDLGEYINELSKQFPEVSFAKLSRIAVRVAKWQKDRIMKDAIKTL